MKKNVTTKFSISKVPFLGSLILIAAMNISACAVAQQPDATIEAKTISAPSTPSDVVAENSILPSTLIKYVHVQHYLQPEWKQGEIVSALLPLARTENLDDHERFFLGQLNFMAFQGQIAYDIFGEFTERDDWYGWIARARQTIIDARFFGNFERLEQKVKFERENFSFKPEYSDMPGFGERSLCGHWAEIGEHDRAVELALATIAATPKNAPYGTLTLVESCYPSFEQNGRKNEAFELAEDISNDLTATLKNRNLSRGDHPFYDEMLFENIIDDRWYHRSLRAPYNYQSHNIEKMIEGLEKFLACHRERDENSCPG